MASTAEASIADTAGVLEAVAERLDARPFWRARVRAVVDGDANHRVHLAVFKEPYLALLLNGSKTVESRFSRRRVPPYRAVSEDDLMLVKRVAGPVVGIALIGTPGFYELDQRAWVDVRRRFARALCAEDDGFWEARGEARYATILPVKATVPIGPVAVAKRDRRGWVALPPVITEPAAQLSLTQSL
jgi:hypothetical protein